MSKKESVKPQPYQPKIPKNLRVFIASMNNTQSVHEYVKNGFFGLGWILGWYGVKAVSKTFDEHPISLGRGNAVEEAIKGKYDYLFFVDSDVVVPTVGILQLIDDNKEVVSGWYLARKSGLPVVMKRIGKFTGWRNWDNFNTYRSYGALDFNSLQGTKNQPYLVKVNAVGAGCLLIKRETFSKLELPYFFESHTKFHDFGEDLAFCEGCGKADVPVWVDKRVFCGHIGEHMFHMADWKLMLQAEIEKMELDNKKLKDKTRKV